MDRDRHKWTHWNASVPPNSSWSQTRGTPTHLDASEYTQLSQLTVHVDSRYVRHLRRPTDGNPHRQRCRPTRPEALATPRSCIRREMTRPRKPGCSRSLWPPQPRWVRTQCNRWQCPQTCRNTSAALLFRRLSLRGKPTRFNASVHLPLPRPHLHGDYRRVQSLLHLVRAGRHCKGSNWVRSDAPTVPRILLLPWHVRN